MHSTIPKGNMGDDQYTVPDDCSYRTYFCCFPLALANTFPWPFVPILSNFFEKKRTQNHPQCLSGWSRALFPTTFLEIAVFISKLVCEVTRTENCSCILIFALILETLAQIASMFHHCSSWVYGSVIFAWKVARDSLIVTLFDRR